MNQQQIETTVLAVLAAILKIEASVDSTRKNTPQWDSLKHIEVIFSVEDEMGVLFSEEEMAGLDSVAGIIETVLQHHAA